MPEEAARRVVREGAGTGSMKLFSSRQTRTLDAMLAERVPLAGYGLMCRAGQACLDALLGRWPRAKSFALLCGAGNNGGDGYVLARLLLGEGREARVYPFGGEAGGDALRARQDYAAAGGSVVDGFPGDVAAEVIVDALFGTGLSRPLDDEALRWVNAVNASAAPVLAVDVPSGLDADTGAKRPQAVYADATVTFVTRKRGMYTAWGRDCCGEITFDNLGAEPDLLARVAPAARLVGFGEVSGWLPPRCANVHKGDFGHVLVVGGGPGMAGAARLAGEAALRAGAGKLSIATTPGNAAAVAAGCPALMAHGVSAGSELEELLTRAGVIVVGPGLGSGDWGRSLMAKVLETGAPKVVDADALSLLAAEGARSERWVLTPHPGEAARLLGISTADVNGDRFYAAQRIVTDFGGVCVLKGSGTVIHSDEGTSVCAGGNPGMATAGMGDVLSGVIAALIAQGLPLRAAAEVGACVHAEAGDRAAGGAPRGLTATDLMPHLRDCVNPVA